MSFAEATSYPNLGVGMQFNVVDAQTARLGSAVSGGGGTNHYKIMYNGSSWVRAA
jgi:hypothetical protein